MMVALGEFRRPPDLRARGDGSRPAVTIAVIFLNEMAKEPVQGLEIYFWGLLRCKLKRSECRISRDAGPSGKRDRPS